MTAAIPPGIPTTTESPSVWPHRLAIVTAMVFAVSTIFPVAAGLTKETSFFPDWWGPADVSIAFLLALLAFAVLAITHGKLPPCAEDAAYRGYRVLLHGLLVMCVVVIYFGDYIVLLNCLTGLAWRAWLLLYGLPAWLAALGHQDNRSASIK